MKISRYKDLDSARASYFSQVSQMADEVRAHYFTEGPGQAMSYERKETQARAFQSGETGPFPWLDKQAARTGESLAAIATAVITQADIWESVASDLEAARIHTKQVIRSAQSVRAMYDATVDFQTTLDQLTSQLPQE